MYDKRGLEEVDMIRVDLEKNEGGKGLEEPNWAALRRKPRKGKNI